MTKRGKKPFRRRKNDAYDTPPEPVLPLLRHLGGWCTFSEPFAGKGALVHTLTGHGYSCISSSDIAPRAPGIDKKDALSITETAADFFISNPPWTRRILHPLILHLSEIAPTWLLFDSDWMHTKQAVPYLKRCQRIVSVGRVSWMFNGKGGMTDCAWYLFGCYDIDAPRFYPRRLILP